MSSSPILTIESSLLTLSIGAHLVKIGDELFEL